MGSLPLRVRVGAVTFWGGRPPSGEGFVIDPKGFLGWDDGTDVRRSSTPRPQSHGAFDVPGFLEARVLSISGTCLASSPLRLQWFRSQLTGLLAEGDAQPVIVDHAGSTLFAMGRLASKTKFETLAIDAATGDYQIQFWFADPRKYGETQVFGPGTTVTAHHYGNFPAAPVLEVAGTIGTGYTINGPDGKTFTVAHAVTSGHPHTIDMATGYLCIDGLIVVGAVTVGQTWPIPGGAVVSMTLVPVSGTGELTVSVPPTFI